MGATAEQLALAEAALRDLRAKWVAAAAKVASTWYPIAATRQAAQEALDTTGRTIRYLGAEGLARLGDGRTSWPAWSDAAEAAWQSLVDVHGFSERWSLSGVVAGGAQNLADAGRKVLDLAPLAFLAAAVLGAAYLVGRLS